MTLRTPFIARHSVLACALASALAAPAVAQDAGKWRKEERLADVSPRRLTGRSAARLRGGAGTA